MIPEQKESLVDRLNTFLAIEPFDDFARVLDRAVFRPVSDEAFLGVSDIVNSTAAIAAGRYKVVNMAGAAVISAVMNVLPGEVFPFMFGGDGASFIVEPWQRERAEQALAACATFTSEEFGLELRVAMVPVKDIRAAGHDLAVARFAPSPHVSYAMFSGGGIEWAEAAMKAGDYALAPAAPGSRPDLTNLSCRWSPIGNRRGTILSLIVRAAPQANPDAFAAVTRRLLDVIAAREAGHGRPGLPEELEIRWPPQGFDLEARATRRSMSLARARLQLLVRTLMSFIILRTGMRVGTFDPAHYRQVSLANTDFRKFDDGLRMTLDCSHATADEIERLLAEAEAQGVLRFGSHRQDAAQMTCIVPSALTDTHLHFLDGAGGGYALAAQRMKGAAAARAA
jgi:Protein of unknown function (DUF3095)